MALVVLNIANRIVTIGFTTIFITLGIIAVVLVAMHGEALSEKQNGPGGDGSGTTGE